MAKRTGMFGMIRAAFTDFSQDDGPTQAAALSYYTVVSLPPLLVLIVVLASLSSIRPMCTTRSRASCRA